ncbi:MAG: NAD(P)/FAD-dependent oxidoreductase [Candidatus Omnitrophota bacterium]|jgi:hypothetical protein
MRKFDTIVIGGGASGIIAAISARRNGRNVMICERMNRLGKKILVSGGGRCNISNADLSEARYNTGARELVKNVFSRFGKEDIEKFFNEIGLRVYPEGDRLFPVTNQAASVLKVLEEELKRLKIPVESGFNAAGIAARPDGKGYLVKFGSGDVISADSVIITGGGRSYPSLGSDGSCYGLARSLGHKIIEPVPSAVPLLSKDRFCHFLQGQRIQCSAKSVIEGKIKKEAKGELLFTKYGLSGTAILDISEDISIALNRLGDKAAAVLIDMVPFMSAVEIEKEIEKRIQKGIAPEDLMTGLLPNKFSLVFRDLFKGLNAGEITGLLKNKRFDIIGTRGWNEAEFTAGGVDTRDVREDTLESKLKKGVYFAGEILDVNAGRGGYNLAWAWASGYIAGLTK